MSLQAKTGKQSDEADGTEGPKNRFRIGSLHA